MNKIKAVIIDDEKLARELIKNYSSRLNNIEIIGESENGFDGVKAIQELNPDLIFLDIQMPKINGFEMLELIENPPEVIFTTAFDEYALKAFDVNAVDYLLKPFAFDRFAEALNKSEQKIISGNANRQNSEIPPEEILSRVVVKSSNKINIIDCAIIICLEAQDDYVNIITEDGKFLKQKTMSYFEKNLDPAEFVRIHRSSIINFAFLDKIEKLEKENYLAIMKNGMKFSISKSGYSALKKLMD